MLFDVGSSFLDELYGQQHHFLLKYSPRETSNYSLLTCSFSGPDGHHFLQFIHFHSLLFGYNAADYFQDCLAHASHHGYLCCRVSVGRRKHFRRTGKKNDLF